jgi:hypothetical protein
VFRVIVDEVFYLKKHLINQSTNTPQKNACPDSGQAFFIGIRKVIYK